MIRRRRRGYHPHGRPIRRRIRRRRHGRRLQTCKLRTIIRTKKIIKRIYPTIILKCPYCKKDISVKYIPHCPEAWKSICFHCNKTVKISIKLVKWNEKI